jgi:hypothetical protein
MYRKSRNINQALQHNNLAKTSEQKKRNLTSLLQQHCEHAANKA